MLGAPRSVVYHLAPRQGTSWPLNRLALDPCLVSRPGLIGPRRRLLEHWQTALNLFLSVELWLPV